MTPPIPTNIPLRSRRLLDETFAKHPLLPNVCVRLIRLRRTQNTLSIPVVKIFVLTRGIHAPRPYGQLDSCPIPLSCGIVLDLEQN